MPVHSAWLHQTGDPALDQIWVEYNGLLCAPSCTRGDRATFLQRAIEALLSEGWCEEVHLSMLPAEDAQAFLARVAGEEQSKGDHAPREASLTLATSNRMRARTTLHVAGYLRSLVALRSTGRSVIEALSANTRAQVRRSLRGYEAKYGHAELCVAKTTEEALSMFERAGVWHRQRWPNSGYDNPRFVDFHHGLISRNFCKNGVALIELRFGEHSAGVFYYLLEGGWVFFYLQGVQPENDGRLKPGLTGHALIMQHFLEQGFDFYDFMGGDSQYKRQLADEQTEFMSLHVHNGALKFRLEDWARNCRNHLRRWLRHPGHAGSAAHD